MMDVLEFIFGDFWHFIGTVLILMIICGSPIVSINHYHHHKDDDEQDE